ncbi:MAG: NAD(+) synthase [Oscillospiraceae bacterium]|nr:NAD(+) synthase [Oscillospiraceae bacterium]
MDAISRVAAIIPKINTANPPDCLEEIAQALSELPEGGFDIAVTPCLALCGPGCGSLGANPALVRACTEALEEAARLTAGQDSFFLCGTIADIWGQNIPAMAVLCRGELIALIPAAGESAPPGMMPADTVFAAGTMRFCVVSCGLDDLARAFLDAAGTGCDLVIITAYDPVWAGRISEIKALLQSLSAATGCAAVLVNGGIGDSSSPYAYRGFAAVYECGEELAFALGENRSFSVTVDLDGDVIRADKRSKALKEPVCTVHPLPGRSDLLRPVNRNPFLPQKDIPAYLDELFLLQARSLASRMENTGITKLVLGVSGGLDSTAALLAGVKALELLGLPRENLTGITMPGFGTSDQTYYNALSLLENLKVTRRDISIKQAVRQHFEDIGHTGEKDTAYENAQARERTQILMDIANMTGALVVGTGDLSEEALGFATFGGDHLANYNVNSCITKTVLRELVAHLADTGGFGEVSGVLRDILDTPVSPELIPPDEYGEITQKTEEILGPYALHDFFLYYFVKCSFAPSKLYSYACAAFAGELEPQFIREKLDIFIRRFCAGQFKRACAPDAASITEVNLLGVNFTVPSDLDPSFLLRGLRQD